MRTALYSPVSTRLAEIMKRARLDAGMTQAELAEATGRTQAYISKFESRQLRLDVEDLIQFCVALRIDPHTVIDELWAVAPFAHLKDMKGTQEAREKSERTHGDTRRRTIR